jgi:hypothetical protein
MRRLAALASAVLALGSSGCPSSARTIPDGGRGDAGSTAEIPIPDGLILKAALRDPDALWARLQRGAGGPLALLPSTLSGLATALVGAGGPLGVDGHGTSFAAVVARRQGGDGGDDRDAGGVDWVIAMPAAGEARAPAARPDGSFVWELEPGWLVLASDSQTLSSAGPYVARRLPSDCSLASIASFTAIAPASAVAGPVAARLMARWAATRAWLLDSARTEREAHGGRAPDFTDPVAIVDTADALVKACVARLAGAGDVRIEGDAGDDDLRVDVRATPGVASPDFGDGGTMSTVALGDTGPLAELPSGAPLALLVRSNLAQREAFARKLSGAVAYLLASGAPTFEAGVDAATLEWAQATGDWMTLSLAGVGGLNGPGLWIRTPVASDSTSRAGAPRAVHDLFALSKRPPLRTLLEGAFHVGPAVFDPDGGGVSSATFSRVDGGRSPNVPNGHASGSPGAAWSVNQGELSLVVGPEPLRRMVQAAPTPPLQADDPRTARVLSAVGEGVAWALLAQPLRFGRTGAAAPSAPLVVAGGARAGGLWARVDVADELFAEGVRLGGGLF